MGLASLPAWRCMHFAGIRITSHTKWQINNCIVFHDKVVIRLIRIIKWYIIMCFFSISNDRGHENYINIGKLILSF